MHLILFVLTLIASSTGLLAQNCEDLAKEKARLRCHALSRGLPENATWADITRADSEKSRKHFAVKAGLPETASWADISHAHNEESRKSFAAQAGLPEDATWADISEAMRKKD